VSFLKQFAHKSTSAKRLASAYISKFNSKSNTADSQLKGSITILLRQERQNVAGLCKVYFQLSLNTDQISEQQKLEMQVLSGDDELGSFPIANDDISQENWFAINTHKLNNGKHKFTLQLLLDKEPQLYNSFVISIKNEGLLANKVGKSLKQSNSPTIIYKDCNSRLFDFQNEDLKPWFDTSNAHQRLEQKAEAHPIAKQYKSEFESFLTHGFMVLENILDDKFIENINRDIDDAVKKKVQGYEEGSSQRIMGLHNNYKHIHQLWKQPKVIQILEQIFEDAVRPCQTLTYVYGSQQSYHQDTVHLTPFPAGYMCGVWVALEDIKAGSGELRVLKGSHRLPRIYRETSNCPQVIDNQWDEFSQTVDKEWQRLIADHKFEEMSYLAKKGDILIWHENLMHGGSVRIDNHQSRRSIVSHYFAQGALGFYDSSGLPAVLD